MTATSLPRGRPRSQEADMAIAEATLDLLIEHGYEGTSMQAIAQRAGVSTATLYRRWQNKIELVLHVVHVQTDITMDIDCGSLYDDLMQIGTRAQQLFNGKLGKVLRAVIGEAQRNAELGTLLAEQSGDNRKHELNDVVARAVARGEIPTPQHVDVFCNMLIGAMMARLLVTGEPLDDAFFEALTRYCVTALGGTSPVRSPA